MDVAAAARCADPRDGRVELNLGLLGEPPLPNFTNFVAPVVGLVSKLVLPRDRSVELEQRDPGIGRDDSPLAVPAVQVVSMGGDAGFQGNLWGEVGRSDLDRVVVIHRRDHAPGAVAEFEKRLEVGDSGRVLELKRPGQRDEGGGGACLVKGILRDVVLLVDGVSKIGIPFRHKRRERLEMFSRQKAESFEHPLEIFGVFIWKPCPIPRCGFGEQASDGVKRSGSPGSVSQRAHALKNLLRKLAAARKPSLEGRTGTEQEKRLAQGPLAPSTSLISSSVSPYSSETSSSICSSIVAVSRSR